MEGRTRDCEWHLNGELNVWCKDCRELICECCAREEKGHLLHETVGLNDRAIALQLREEMRDLARHLRHDYHLARDYQALVLRRLSDLKQARTTHAKQLDHSQKAENDVNRKIAKMSAVRIRFGEHQDEAQRLLNQLEPLLNDLQQKPLAAALMMRKTITQFLLSLDLLSVPAAQSLRVPHHISKLSQDNKTLELGAQISNRMWGKAGAFADEYGRWILGIAFSSRNTLYMVDHLNNKVCEYALDGTFLGRLERSPAADMVEPWGMVFDPSNSGCVVADRRNHRFARFDKDNKFMDELRFEPQRQSLGVAIAPATDKLILFELGSFVRVVRNSTQQTLYQIDGHDAKDTHLKTALGTGGMAVDERGDLLYIVDHDVDAVKVFRLSDGHYLRAIDTELQRPYHIAVEPFSGDVIVANQNRNRLSVWTRAGDFVRHMHVGYRPVGLAINAEGNLLAVTRTHGNAGVYGRPSCLPESGIELLEYESSLEWRE